MSISEAQIRAEIGRTLQKIGVGEIPEIGLERPRNPEHGDLATNVALALARPLRRPPRQVAEEIVARLDRSAAGVESAEIAGPGFINFRIARASLHGSLAEVLRQGCHWGTDPSGAGQPVVVEFVSANPTGPLHIGHGRQAALGDATCRLLEWTGWQVHREFYYNDAGEQINRLAQSVWTRYQQRFGREIPFPEDGYHGGYIGDLAERFAIAEGGRFVGEVSPEALEAMRRFAVAELRDEQQRDLRDFRVEFDEFFLESSLFPSGRVDEVVRRLAEAGVTYEKDGALWLRTTAFGDDKDRVMIRSNGQPTYFLPDVAYHLHKWERGFHSAINVQGADHHGTVARVRAGVRALGLVEGYPEYVLHQMVTVLRGGEEVKFSKRAGSYVTFRELYEEVGVDVARYFFLMRRPDSQLLFDIDLALEESDKNPVYKVQYAHARLCSVFRRAGQERDSVAAENAALDRLVGDAEIDLIKQVLRFPEVVRSAAAAREPHAVCAFLEELSGVTNAWYHAGNRDRSLRVLSQDSELTGARLVLARAVQLTLANGLATLGVAAPEAMAREPEPE